jgi:hypothetical protein
MSLADWLSAHGAELRPSKDGNSWSIYFGGTLEYVLCLAPAGGKFACRVAQTINGKRLDKGQSFPTPDDAARGGLEDLRAALGW